jgi:hypothetical protein
MPAEWTSAPEPGLKPGIFIIITSNGLCVVRQGIELHDRMHEGIIRGPSGRHLACNGIQWGGMPFLSDFQPPAMAAKRAIR